MKSLVVVFAMLVCSVSTAFASDGAKTNPVKLNDAQLDEVSAGFFDISINVSPVITVQNATAVTNQISVLGAGYQEAITAALNSADVKLGIKQ